MSFHMLARLKPIFETRTTSAVLCVVLLLLMANTVFLNRVKEEKSEVIDQLTEHLQTVQQSFSTGKQHPLLARLETLQPYGLFLKTVIPIFNEANARPLIQGVRLRQTSTPHFGRKHRKSSEEDTNSQLQTLTLQGAIALNGGSQPYAVLHDKLAKVQGQTGCTLKLMESLEGLKEAGGVDAGVFNFQILLPESQAHCLSGYLVEGAR